MVTLNILLILLGFINSLNKKPRNVDPLEMDIGIVELSDEKTYC